MDYIEKVSLEPSFDFKRYKKLTPRIFQETLKLAKELHSKKIIHINSTQLGGGVSEILRNEIPLERLLGIDSNWYIIKAPIEFFKITKKIHNLLQGEKGFLKDSEKYFYLKWIYSKITPSFKRLIVNEAPQIVIIHDPQPLPLIDYLKNNNSSFPIPVLRLHIDLSSPNPNVLDFIKPFVEEYRLVILSHKSYRPDWLAKEKTRIVMPAINPFSEKNRLMEKDEAKNILSYYHINPNQPIIAQVARFDPWKDPLGTLKAYYLAKNKIPKLQLILAGFFQAYDDPQALSVFKQVSKEAKGDPDVFLFADPSSLKDISNDLFINAVYTVSDVIIQKSIKEGFGLTVTEAMWKGKPVIGGKTKGIGLQITDGQNGFLVTSIEEAAQKIISLLENNEMRKRIGKMAYQTVKKKFLMSRLILDYLKIYNELF